MSVFTSELREKYCNRQTEIKLFGNIAKLNSSDDSNKENENRAEGIITKVEEFYLLVACKRNLKHRVDIEKYIFSL